MIKLQSPGFWIAVFGVIVVVVNHFFSRSVWSKVGGGSVTPATRPTLHVGGHATFHVGERELVGVVKKIHGQRVRMACVGRDGRRRFVLRKAHEVSPLAS